MTEEKKFLALMQVTVPPDTILTVTSEIKILQMLGIVNDPELSKALDFAGELVPANTPATLHALITLLGNLVKHHPKSTSHHHDELATLLKKFADVPDATLTYGDFLSLCESLMKAIHARRNEETGEKLKHKH